jgi:hypothetical protein
MSFAGVLWILCLFAESSVALVSLGPTQHRPIVSSYYSSSATTTTTTTTTTPKRSTILLLWSSSPGSSDHDEDEDDDDNNSSQNQQSSSLSSSNDDKTVIVDPVVQLPLLEAKWAVATTTTTTQEERDALQQQIHNAKLAGEFGVRKAQVDFYTAFSTQNLEGMQEIWAQTPPLDDDCQCIHPGMQCIVGRDAILESWAVLFQGGGAGFAIEPAEDARIDICGATAICKCVEQINGGEGSLEALNVYKRENGSWKMTLHMASPFLAASASPPS